MLPREVEYFPPYPSPGLDIAQERQRDYSGLGVELWSEEYFCNGDVADDKLWHLILR